jgi:hypothetical protein
MRRLLELFVIGLVACGGRIDDGTDASVEAGGIDAISKIDVPQCLGINFQCNTSAECCSGYCNFVCTGKPPPPPSCQPDGTPCTTDGECCSNVCNGTCGTQVACATSSNKQCDICVATNCCKEFLNCGSDPTCSKWLGCVQDCEQQGQSALACAQSDGGCGPAVTTTEGVLSKCAQASCAQPCSVD